MIDSNFNRMQKYFNIIFILSQLNRQIENSICF